MEIQDLKHLVQEGLSSQRVLGLSIDCRAANYNRETHGAFVNTADVVAKVREIDARVIHAIRPRVTEGIARLGRENQFLMANASDARAPLASDDVFKMVLPNTGELILPYEPTGNVGVTANKALSGTLPEDAIIIAAGVFAKRDFADSVRSLAHNNNADVIAVWDASNFDSVEEARATLTAEEWAPGRIHVVGRDQLFAALNADA